jgi:putative ATP-dependent endonuclease of OLD family
MKLVNFTVEKYRSITKAHKIRLEKTAILVGPNNEGKSNILRALVAAMNILTRDPRQAILGSAAFSRFVHRYFYDWSTDFPIHLQSSEPNGESVMILEFQLTEEERKEFEKEIGSTLKGTLPLRIALGPEETKVRVYKRGKGAKVLTAKSNQIANFLSMHLDFEHIPAVRTAQSAQRIVDQMVERELIKVEDDPEYEKSLRKIEHLQKPILDLLSSSIKETLVKFLPAISDVRVQVASEERSRALRRSCEIVINDGTPTLLKYKGDGVQSLAALGIMRHASERGARGRNLVIAIEEPESHLHPNAIHELRAVMNELSEKHQVVITTHCPLFVDRATVSNNIIVQDKKARPAKRIQEIRDILGVRASDNLRHAELVLLVEGDDDARALKSLLSYASRSLKSAIDNGTLAIESLGGGSNLSYKAGLIRDSLCLAHCFLDDDRAGHSSFERAKLQGLLTEADANFSICPGMREAELEDFYDPNIYEDLIRNTYRVTIQSPKFKTNKKWSERMQEVFRQQGKRWTDQVEKELKDKISEVIAAKPENALISTKRTAFDGLVSALEQRLHELPKGRTN